MPLVVKAFSFGNLISAQDFFPGEYWPFAAVFSFFLTTLERESEFRGQCILETSSSHF